MRRFQVFKRTVSTVALASAMLMAIAGIAQASVIFPGDTIFAPPEAGPVGAKLEASLTVPIVAPTFTGVLHSDVYSGDLSNALGGLTFTYWIENFGPNSLSRFTISSFTGFATDVSYEPTGAPPAVVPTLADRGPGPGDVVGFSYIGAPLGSGKILPGTMSALMVIQTDALRWKTTLASVINGSTAMPESFAPTQIVPEPSSMVLAGLGAVGLIGLAIRRRRA